MHCKYFFILLLISLLSACDSGPEKPEPATAETPPAPVVRAPGCRGCHTDVVLDVAHEFACTDCHGGDNSTSDQEQAHTDLISYPASPENMSRFCGRCHREQVDDCTGSLHFTLNKAINLTRAHFNISPALDSLTLIPTTDDQTSESLVNDMLRRRCLRCHVYSSGDNYPLVHHGRGCAACHLQYVDSSLQKHVFLRTPTDRQCLSCHYGNHVGADYYGWYEHDYNGEYRTPYTTKQPFFRPYGVERHELVRDIHQQKGMICVDCHGGADLHGNGRTIRCADCHAWKPGTPLPPTVQRGEDGGVLLNTVSGKTIPVPQLVHPAHRKYGDLVDCQVCHGQWSFNDSTTHLLRSEYDEYDFMERLTVQGSSRVETVLEHNLNSMEDELEPTMPDGITGEDRPGLWYKGFTQRRWEKMVIGRDADGKIRVMRPILDLHLSAMDGGGEVSFDNLTGKGSGLLPYSPHTTGPAGLFYEQRFLHLLQDNAAHSSTHE